MSYLRAKLSDFGTRANLAITILVLGLVLETFWLVGTAILMIRVIMSDRLLAAVVLVFIASIVTLTLVIERKHVKQSIYACDAPALKDRAF